MLELQGRRRFRRLIYSKVSIVVLVLVLFLLGRSVWGVYEKDKLARYHKQQSYEELQELKQQRDDLASDVSRLETPRGIEEEIRKNFPVADEGEKVITIVEPKASEMAATQATPTPEGFWAKIREIFNRD